MAELNQYDLDKVYLRNDTKLTSISQKIFGNYGTIGSALNYYYESIIHPAFDKEYNKANDKKKEKLDKEKAKFTRQSYLSIQSIQNALDHYVESLEEGHEIKEKYRPSCIADYFKDHFLAEKKEGTDKVFDLISLDLVVLFDRIDLQTQPAGGRSSN